MKKFSTWLLLSFAVVFWILRIMATYMNAMGEEFIMKPLDNTTEIALLFIALICFILIAKRMWTGVIAYLVAYGGYFGVDLYKNMPSISAGTLSANEYMSIFFSFIGIILPILILMDLLLDQNRKDHPTDKKTDWFYKNEKFDRKMDSRADKNNYRTM